MILFQGLRHIIVHNRSKVDSDFRRQIRDTKYKDKYKNEENIQLTEKEYNLAKEIFKNFSYRILILVSNKEIDYLKEETRKLKEKNCIQKTT